jgi:hypothetical protein
MDKKDIYEHLANIYLDASSNKKKKKAKAAYKFRNMIFIGLAVLLSAGYFVFANLIRSKSPVSSQIALVLHTDEVKINFHFDPAKKESFSVNLNKLNLTRYKSLAFSVRKTDYMDKMYLRIEFTSAFNEVSALYLKDISHKWKDYKINFSDFKEISDWSEMRGLSFIVEEWNAKEKKDIVYIDNIRILRE